MKETQSCQMIQEWENYFCAALIKLNFIYVSAAKQLIRFCSSCSKYRPNVVQIVFFYSFMLRSNKKRSDLETCQTLNCQRWGGGSGLRRRLSASNKTWFVSRSVAEMNGGSWEQTITQKLKTGRFPANTQDELWAPRGCRRLNKLTVTAESSRKANWKLKDQQRCLNRSTKKANGSKTLGKKLKVTESQPTKAKDRVKAKISIVVANKSQRPAKNCRMVAN